MTMKRFTETRKWSDPWFRSLSPVHKCLWSYLCDNCDHIGLIRIDWPLASFVIGAQVTPDDLKHFAGRIEDHNDGCYWLPKFCTFQYKTLSRHSPPQRKVLDDLEHNGLLNRVNGCCPKQAQASQAPA